MTTQVYVPRFFLKQKFSLTANRFELYETNPDLSFGRLLGFAQQKRLAFKEEVTFYTDESKSQTVFSFKARKAIDLGSGYDVLDAQRNQIGFFKKDFGKSLLRSTFHIEGAGYAGTGQERNKIVAFLRRFSDIPFLPVHFDFVGAEGQSLMSVERQASVRDKYTVSVPDQRVDFRVAAAMAVGCDVLMSR